MYNADHQGDGAITQFIVTAENDRNTQAYDVKVVVNKPETGAVITGLSVNGTAATIARNVINVRCLWVLSCTPVSLDIEASKMATVLVDNVKYDPKAANDRFDVNDDVTIKVTSENKATTNTYTLKVVVSDSFNDVPTSEWYYDEVMTAANAGWVNGVGDGYFEPNGTMKRGDFAVIIARILGCDTEATVESKFPDCNETDYFNAAVTFCKLRGIIDGDDKGYFNPYDASPARKWRRSSATLWSLTSWRPAPIPSTTTLRSPSGPRATSTPCRPRASWKVPMVPSTPATTPPVLRAPLSW